MPEATLTRPHGSRGDGVRRSVPAPRGYRVCIRCRNPQREENFNRNARSADGRDSYCRSCRTEMSTASALKHGRTCEWCGERKVRARFRGDSTICRQCSPAPKGPTPKDGEIRQPRPKPVAKKKAPTPASGPRTPQVPPREAEIPKPHRYADRRYAHVDDAQLLCLIHHGGGMDLGEIAYQLSTYPAHARRRLERLGELVERDPHTEGFWVSAAGMTYLRDRASSDPIST